MESPYNQIQQAVRYVLKIYLIVLLFIKRMWRKKRFLAVNWMILQYRNCLHNTTLQYYGFRYLLYTGIPIGIVFRHLEDNFFTTLFYLRFSHCFPTEISTGYFFFNSGEFLNFTILYEYISTIFFFKFISITNNLCAVLKSYPVGTHYVIQYGSEIW